MYSGWEAKSKSALLKAWRVRIELRKNGIRWGIETYRRCRMDGGKVDAYETMDKVVYVLQRCRGCIYEPRHKVVLIIALQRLLLAHR